ncbi:hypothetical protein PUN28_008539 [Cardiocondyla obscurior]|uniref:Uncharacterized protein n=1 Tax=Cardiocondyla obscurior TaxID=286306 RepID=A0AAW2FY55_9HYME
MRCKVQLKPSRGTPSGHDDCERRDLQRAANRRSCSIVPALAFRIAFINIKRRRALCRSSARAAVCSNNISEREESRRPSLTRESSRSSSFSRIFRNSPRITHIRSTPLNIFPPP